MSQSYCKRRHLFALLRYLGIPELEGKQQKYISENFRRVYDAFLESYKNTVNSGNNPYVEALTAAAKNLYAESAKETVLPSMAGMIAESRLDLFSKLKAKKAVNAKVLESIASDPRYSRRNSAD